VPSELKDNIVACCTLESGAEQIVTDDRRGLLSLKVSRIFRVLIPSALCFQVEKPQPLKENYAEFQACASRTQASQIPQAEITPLSILGR